MPLPRPLGWITRWPLPALGVWLLAWGVHGQALLWRAPQWLGFVAAVSVGIAGTLLGRTRLQKLVVAGGFPVSLAVLGLGSDLPVALWLLPVAVLMALYPMGTWSDAPVFPTPASALDGLSRVAPLVGDRSRGSARVLDAGCGLGHALRALRREYPQALIEGIEGSWPLMGLCALRCRWARVRQGDFWAEPWTDYDLVYLFQRPESMPRAVEKAQREMRSSAYLVSLEFEAPGLQPVATLPGADGRRVWLYRPAVDRAAPQRRSARPERAEPPRPGGLPARSRAVVGGEVIDVVERSPRA